jgi:putative adhesin
MRRHRFAGSVAIVIAVIAFGPGADDIARATRGVINLPRMARNGDAFQWHGVVAEGRTIEIKGVNGDVSAEAASGPEVEVSADRRGRRSNPDDVRMDVVEHDGSVTICAVYPSKDPSRPNECRPGTEGRMNLQNNDVTVKFLVKVPRGVRFVGRTVNGEVDAKGLSGPVVLSTVNGSTTFSTTSYGEASTVNGSIRGTMGSAAWNDALTFHTVNGSIVLDLPPTLSADVRASTVNGEISTDFPMSVTGRISRRQVSGTIGGGGRRLDLETVNGTVRLQRR